ncbi:MAG: PPOX class F420-dependent oxidoreductase [Gammaproteobacteria bacterium]
MTDQALTSTFAEARYVSLATFRRNGREVRTPVWFCALDDALYCFSAGDAGKVKRVRANGRGRIARCSMNGTIEDEWHEVKTSLVTDASLVEAVYLGLRVVYGWQMYATDFLSKLSGRYKKRVVIKIEAI